MGGIGPGLDDRVEGDAEQAARDRDPEQAGAGENSLGRPEGEPRAGKALDRHEKQREEGDGQPGQRDKFRADFAFQQPLAGKRSEPDTEAENGDKDRRGPVVGLEVLGHVGGDECEPDRPDGPEPGEPEHRAPDSDLGFRAHEHVFGCRKDVPVDLEGFSRRRGLGDPPADRPSCDSQDADRPREPWRNGPCPRESQSAEDGAQKDGREGRRFDHR